MLRGESAGSRTETHWTHDGSSSGTTVLTTVSPGYCPCVICPAGDRTTGGWSQSGRFGPIVREDGAGDRVDTYFWRTEWVSGSVWKSGFFTGGIDADGTIRAVARGKQFYCYAVMGTDDS